ncbi:hypothetical protein [Chitinophaga arvensicola]|uniref:Uncharacterized protein n=1 Tax=Chitinophaga arvensicola TaxID=29529 RepID=A0A1I0PQJ4_9BACT|nr:hypothetical protein [Chitinophaga arvensicola]SEW16630.1 hypothetical protein SAMN04488122_0915 [Chitinophaga arvensicola]
MADTGRYLTSFLEIYVDTDQSLHNLALLEPGPQGTYFHEYFHFIQDVTTCSGLCKIWNGLDRLRQLISSIQPEAVTELNVPMDGPVADEQRLHMEFLERLRGSGQITGISMQQADSYIITEVLNEPDARIQQYFENSRATVIKLTLESEGRQTKYFNFGEYAVSETMAYMIERKFYPDLNLQPRYPYRVAVDLARRIYPDFCDQEENIFALCDVSLMHNMPGWAFVSILTEMENAGFMPASGEEVIDYGYRYYNGIGWDHLGYMDYADQGIRHVSSKIWDHEFYMGTMQLLQANVERGRILRYMFPHAIVKIYKATQPLSYDFYRAFNFLGGPLSINNAGERTARVPYGLDWLEPISDPSHFRVAWQLGNFLMEGLVPCSLERTCRAARNAVGVDYRCQHGPWQRVTDDQKCPFAAAWFFYGLAKKDIYRNGVLIQQRSEDEHLEGNG